MALIGTIRKNGWILIVLMVMALGGFILMDVISNAQRYRSGDVNTLGKVNDTEIKRAEFDTYEKLIYTNAEPGKTYQVRQQVWDYFVESSLIGEESNTIGLGVGKDELMDLQFGNNLSKVILARFSGPDGQPNRATLSSIKSSIEQGTFTDPTNRAYWAVQEKEIITERLQEKLSTLVIKGIYAPAWQAEMTFKENNERVSFTYVRVPYDKIPDADAKLEDADYAAYLKMNPNLYDAQEETRIIEYVAFDVFPTSRDSAAAYTGIVSLLEGLRAATDDSVYVVSNNGVVDPSYRKKDQLPLSVADSLMSMPVGTIVGPFLDEGNWAIAKILGRKLMPDSVKARHILIREATPANEQKADSLIAILNAKTLPFDTLAVQNSQDGSASKGGDLGWFAEGRMVPEFNAVCFNEGEQGKYYKVATEFGWHIIEITGKKFIKNESGVRAAYLRQLVEPSTETQQAVKDKALAMIQKAKKRADFAEQAKKQNLPVQVSQSLRVNDFAFGNFGSDDEAREVIRWTFEEKTDVDAVSQEIFAFRDPKGGYFDSKYMVATLKSIIPAGKATVAALKANSRAETSIRNLKKAEIIKSKIKNAGDQNALAEQWKVPVDTAGNTSLLQPFLPSGGMEPRVVGTAFSLKKGDVSKPITGESGVYVAKILTDIPKVPNPPDLTLFRRQITSSMSTGIQMNLLTTWKKQVTVEDNRSRFF